MSRIPRVSDTVAAENCRAILAQLTVNGRVDHKAFLTEMESRAASIGRKISKQQYKLLARIVAAYESERVQS
jgi:hypothetical protein